MNYMGCVKGTLTAMYSYVIDGEGTIDVYVPPNFVGIWGRPPKLLVSYPPGIAQITLFGFNQESSVFGSILSVRATDENGQATDSEINPFTNCVYWPQMARVTFVVYALPSAPGAIGSDHFLVNLFQFSLDSGLQPTPNPAPPYGGGGE